MDEFSQVEEDWKVYQEEKKRLEEQIALDAEERRKRQDMEHKKSIIEYNNITKQEATNPGNLLCKFWHKGKVQCPERWSELYCPRCGKFVYRTTYGDGW